MGFKMKSSPYGEKRSGEMDMKPRNSKNFENSGMKNADGSAVKPGAPGLLGKILDPLGLFKKGKKLLGGKGKGADGAQAAPGALDPATGEPINPAAAAGAAAGGAAAAPAAAPAGVMPPDPTLGAAPVQMRKASPAKDTKTWTAQEMRGTAWMDKDAHNKKHKRKEMGADHKPIKKDKKDIKQKDMKK